MKKFSVWALCAVLLTSVLGSCQKDQVLGVSDGLNEEIILSVADGSIDMEVQTKAAEITSVPSSLYLERTTGTWKSETSKNASASKTVSSGKINTGWYQTATPTAYNYYVSNKAITFAAGGSTISASNDTDVIAGCTQAATNSTTPSVTLDHVFARTGSLTANAPSGYTISDITWKIQSNTGAGTAGTYNIATKAWSSTTALSQTTFTGSSDLYLVPGSYTITLSYKLTKGDWNNTFSKTATVSLAAGKVNSISTTVPADGGATEIVLSVSLTAWGTNSLTPTFS